MNEITSENINEYVLSGVYDIAGAMSKDQEGKENKESKNFTLRFTLDKVSIKDILTPALGAKKITWVNSKGRKLYDGLKDREVINLNYVSAGKGIKTREESIAELIVAFRKAGVPEEQAIELATKSVDNPEVLR